MIEIRAATAIGWGEGGIHESTQDNCTCLLLDIRKTVCKFVNNQWVAFLRSLNFTGYKFCVNWILPLWMKLQHSSQDRN